MRWSEIADQHCSVARALSVIGERWTMLVIREAFNGVRRFEDFQQHLDVARNILTTRLQRLVEAGVLARVPYQDKPVRYEYRLTESGRELFPILVSMMSWGDRWLADKKGAPLEIKHRDCGHTGMPELRCSGCNERLHAHNSTLERGPGLPQAVWKLRVKEIERLRALRARAVGARADSPE